MEAGILMLLWILACWIVGWLGSTRTIGYGWAVLLSVFLTPVIALVIVLFSKKKSDVQAERKLHQQIDKISQTEYLEKIFNLKEKGAITEDEYIKMKNDFFNKNPKP